MCKRLGLNLPKPVETSSKLVASTCIRLDNASSRHSGNSQRLDGSLAFEATPVKALSYVQMLTLRSLSATAKYGKLRLAFGVVDMHVTRPDPLRKFADHVSRTVGLHMKMHGPFGE